MITVAHNMASLNAMRQLNTVCGSQRKTTEKLSSGYRINRAADDAAGLTISEKMRSQIRGLNQGSDNIQAGVSLVQVADGALAEVNSMLQRMTQLSVKAANGTLAPEDRAAIQKEIQEISNEINRISKSTEFNTKALFDDVDVAHPDGKAVDLVGCKAIVPGTNNGHITEAYQDTNGKWHPAAILDFDNLSLENIEDLDEQGFSFTCSASCSEAFEISFNLGKGDSCSNLVGAVTHKYDVDITGCTSGSEILDRVLDYVAKNPSSKSEGQKNTTNIPGALAVSHSNSLIREGNKIVIAGYITTNTEAEALSEGAKYTGSYGRVHCSDMTKKKTHPLQEEFNIQCSNNVNDFITIKTHRMNTAVLGINKIDASTIEGAKGAIDAIEKAGDIISSFRSDLGAYQNRLEAAFRNNENKAENTQAAESAIRDADMAKEMVKFTKDNILNQVGTSMLSQTNQNSQSILQLLQ